MSELTDPVGVLSVYVTVEPQARTDPSGKPPWELRLRHQLDEVRERLAGRGTRAESQALAARLDALRMTWEELLDPATSGRGRALFAGVAGGATETLTLQVPLGDHVALAPRAHLRPLVAAWSMACPAGVVSVGVEELRVVDTRLGRAEPVTTIPVHTPDQRRELKGPAAGHPGVSQRGAPQLDLYARREEDRLVRQLRATAPRLAELSRRWGWTYLALTGDAPLVQAVREGLPAKLPAEVVTLDHPVNSLPPPRLVATVAPALAEARRRRHRALAAQARSNAMAANTGAYGLGETLGALQEGRVAHLLMAADGRWAGHRAPDGFLVPDGEVPPGVTPDQLVPEPYLGERMIELAFRDSAEVTILEPEAAAPLAEADRVGALLRW